MSIHRAHKDKQLLIFAGLTGFQGSFNNILRNSQINKTETNHKYINMKSFI